MHTPLRGEVYEIIPTTAKLIGVVYVENELGVKSDCIEGAATYNISF